MTDDIRRDGVEILEKTAPYRGYFRIDRYVLRHRLHRGGWSPAISREVFERGHAVAVLLYDSERDEVVLNEQFRVGAYAAGRDPWLIEIAAGIIGQGETEEAVARREVTEETGLEVGELIPVYSYLASPGGTSETVALFCGRVDAGKAGGVHGLDHESEDIRVFALKAEEAFGWLAAGRIANSMTIIALQWLALNRATLQERWQRKPR